MPTVTQYVLGLGHQLTLQTTKKRLENSKINYASRITIIPFHELHHVDYIYQWSQILLVSWAEISTGKEGGSKTTIKAMYTTHSFKTLSHNSYGWSFFFKSRSTFKLC